MLNFGNYVQKWQHNERFRHATVCCQTSHLHCWVDFSSIEIGKLLIKLQPSDDTETCMLWLFLHIHCLMAVFSVELSLPPVDSIWAMVIVWRLGGKIDKSGFLTYLSTPGIDPFRFQAGGRRRRPNLALFFFLVYFMLLYILLRMCVCFCRVCFSFFSTKSRDWLGRTSLKWLILCPVGRKTLTQSISLPLLSHRWRELDVNTGSSSQRSHPLALSFVEPPRTPDDSDTRFPFMAALW